MGFYSSTGSLNVTSTDTGGRGLYSTTNLLRITLVSGVSYVGLYASDGSLNVVDSSADTTLRGLYHPSGALRGISAPSTYTGIYSPSGGLYMNGLFTIQGLFANGEQGGWYDPSDFSTLFEDAAGTIPITTVEKPVGKVLDKSGRGNHLTQSTSTSRPVLSARVNLLTRTEDFSAAAWTTRSATATAGVITASAGAGDHDVVQSVASATGALTASVELKSGTSSFAWVCLSPTFGLTNYATAVIDLSAGTVSKTQANGTLSISSSTISGVDAEGYRRVTFSVSSASVGVNFIIGICSSATPTISSYGSVDITAAGTETILVRKADLRPTNAGVNLPPYQRVGASTDYDTGFPLYLKFDGTDDFLVSGTINPGSVDKAQVFAGVRKVTDSAAYQVIAESSNSVDANNGSFVLATNVGTYEIFSKGTVRANAPASGYSAPITNVVASLLDISGDLTTLRVNGGQVAQSTADQGTGNFGSYPLYVGSRAGTYLRFNGQLYSLILRFSAANLDAATIASTETWVNGKTKAY